MWKSTIARGVCCVLAAALLLAAAAAELPSIVANRVDEGKKAVAIVVGTTSSEGRRIVARGRMAKDRAGEVNADTVFEIGSISKVFTSLLLADMIERGEVTPETPVAALLPDSVKVPERNGKRITLLDLSMQISGLPRMPNNFRPADPANPFADYTALKLYEYLSGYTLARDPGEQYDYSNVGVGLLGHALERKAGLSYEELLRRRILAPLGMTSTSITLSAEQKKRLAIGHDGALTPVKNWDLDVLAGAGAIRSTANDMLAFLEANLEMKPTPLAAAMRRMRSVQHATPVPDLEILMGWHRFTRYGTAIVWHNGGTGGYRSFAGMDLATRRAVVVLSNTSASVDDIGLHALEPKWPVQKFEAPKPEITVDPKILESYAGEYALGPVTMTITTSDGRLYAQITGQPRFELFASRETEFFLKVVDAQVTFVRGETGKVTHLVLHQAGTDQKAMKK